MLTGEISVDDDKFQLLGNIFSKLAQYAGKEVWVLGGLDPETLNALPIAKHDESVQQPKQLQSNSQESEHVKLMIEKYRRMIFGRKSEKLTRELEQLELRLEEREKTQAADQAGEAATEAEQPSSP